MQEAEKLVSHKVHPQTIIAGWRKAADYARKALTDSAKDNSANEEKFREVELIGVCVWGGRGGGSIK